MRVALHDYRTDPLLPQKDGVNLAHENIAQLLRFQTNPAMTVSFHDFPRLLADEESARAMLDGVDCVISNIGPHAHYYFWLRERLGLDFRIIRDVRTAIWSSYLHQEHLCQPYLRPYDTLLVASNYTWGIYNKMFPHLADFPTTLCYPLSVCFPAERPAERPLEQPTGSDFVLGYLGRLSEDKNFPDIIDLLIRLNSDDKRTHRYRLVACGDIHSPSCAPSLVRARLVEALGDGDYFDYLPARDNSEIWDLLAQFDAMIFPSTSNLETLGRVLIEASYARVPIISGRHAAAAELIDPSGLCRVHFKEDVTFSAHFDHSLGSVDIGDMGVAITCRALRPSNCYETYSGHPEAFLALIADPNPRFGSPRLSASQAAFIDALSVDLPPALGREAVDAAIAELAAWFIDLQRKGLPKRAERLAQLAARSRHPERTARFIEKSNSTQGDFTNIGGIDIELCHVHDFYPEFRINRR